MDFVLFFNLKYRYENLIQSHLRQREALSLSPLCENNNIIIIIIIVIIILLSSSLLRMYHTNIFISALKTNKMCQLG